jgi:RNA polymerase sigma-70 factor (ECF subfamily)
MTEEQRSFVERIHLAQGILHRICTVYTQEKESRNDLRQEMLLQLWRSYPSFRNRSNFTTWMYRVALNTALGYHRRRQRLRPAVPIEDIRPPKAEDHSVSDAADVELLYRCIRELPKLDRAVILLQLEQKSYREIADVTGLSEGGVSVRIVRIKQKLKTLLRERGLAGEE